jgi:hypothetical protein
MITYGTEDEAIEIANDTVYGLQAYVVSADTRRVHAVAARLQAGSVLINGPRFEPLVPFGGFKQSGIGPRICPNRYRPSHGGGSRRAGGLLAAASLFRLQRTRRVRPKRDLRHLESRSNPLRLRA